MVTNFIRLIKISSTEIIHALINVCCSSVQMLALYDLIQYAAQNYYKIQLKLINTVYCLIKDHHWKPSRGHFFSALLLPNKFHWFYLEGKHASTVFPSSVLELENEWSNKKKSLNFYSKIFSLAHGTEKNQHICSNFRNCLSVSESIQCSKLFHHGRNLSIFRKHAQNTRSRFSVSRSNQTRRNKHKSHKSHRCSDVHSNN